MVIIDYQQDNFQGILIMLDMTISIILGSPLERKTLLKVDKYPTRHYTKAQKLNLIC